MIFDSFPTGIVPKALLASALGYAALSYFGTGPILASRVVRADHMPACERSVRTLVAKAGEQALASVPPPRFDDAGELALRQAENMLNSPLMNQLRGMSGGLAAHLGLDMGGYAASAIEIAREKKRQAEEAYQRAMKEAREHTAGGLAAAGSVCGCIAEAAIEDTRTEWALYAGTFTLHTPALIVGFKDRMVGAASAGACLASEGGAS